VADACIPAVLVNTSMAIPEKKARTRVNILENFTGKSRMNKMYMNGLINPLSWMLLSSNTCKAVSTRNLISKTIISLIIALDLHF
jgi:hypothetical protein